MAMIQKKTQPERTRKLKEFFPGGGFLSRPSRGPLPRKILYTLTTKTINRLTQALQCVHDIETGHGFPLPRTLGAAPPAPAAGAAYRGARREPAGAAWARAGPSAAQSGNRPSEAARRPRTIASGES